MNLNEAFLMMQIEPTHNYSRESLDTEELPIEITANNTIMKQPYNNNNSQIHVGSPKKSMSLKRKFLPRLSSFFDFVNPKRKYSERGEHRDKHHKHKVEPFPLIHLPTELRSLILSFLEPADLLSASLASKELYVLIRTDNSIWKALCYRKWNTMKPQSRTPPKTFPDWRSYFYYKSALCAPEKLSCFSWKSKDVAAGGLPSPRQSLTASTVGGSKMVFIGGQTSVQTRFDDVFVYSTENRTFNKMNILEGTIPKFARHASVAIGHKVYVFGGYDGIANFFGLSVLDTAMCTWATPEIEGDSPIPRTNHQVVAVGDKVYLFGGNDTTKVFANTDGGQFGTFGDFWMLDTEKLQWSQPKTIGKMPCARSGHHMVTVEHLIYIFGGGLWNDKQKLWSERFNDMWVFNTETQEWSEIKQNNPPTHAFISLPNWRWGPFIFVYNDCLYCFDTMTETWHTVKTKGTKPQKRFLGSATFIPKTNTAYMFGGVYSSVVNCFDELSLSIPKNFMHSLLKHEASTKAEEELETKLQKEHNS